MLKINIDNQEFNIPPDRIGIDIGQSLSKLAYVEDDSLILIKFVNQSNIHNIENEIDIITDNFNELHFTGGKSYKSYKTYALKKEAMIFDEFDATVKGLETLHLIKKKKALPPSLVVTIGTGTSMVLYKEKIEHVGGTAMGGGFFMGQVKLLFEINDFQEAITLAERGNRYNVDLKVSDIYDPEDDRVSLLFREFTAASLGKIDDKFNVSDLDSGDLINSLICLIGENVGTLATLMAEDNDIPNIAFCGGFLTNNKIVRKILSLICSVNYKKAIFLENSEFCASIGALLL
jgi:type II pantothenate kinase